MIKGGVKDALVLFLGDIVIIIGSLWVALALRFGRFPIAKENYQNFMAYLPVFIFWLLTFYIVNLYNRETILFRRKLISSIIQASLVNILIATIYFYFLENIGITLGIMPKTILVLELIITTLCVSTWRLYILRTSYKSEFLRTVLMGTSDSINKLNSILTNYPEYRFAVSAYYQSNPEPSLFNSLVKEHNARLLVIDTNAYEGIRSAGSELATLAFSGVRCIDGEMLYEELTNRINLVDINDAWVIQMISHDSKRTYTVLKRIMDILISSVLGIISLIVYPFVALAIKIDDGGDIFISQERVGKNGKIVRLWKFRTMKANDTNKPTLKNDARVTRVGRFIRSSRIDELPQLWNVIQGRVSLVGPRPELPHFVEQYNREIPYYNVRHTVPPGLSGWAQILYNEPAYDNETTRNKLAYDLYYIKNRSFFLDLKIALKTIKTLLMRVGI